MSSEVSGAVALQLAAEIRALGRGECARALEAFMQGDAMVVLGINAAAAILRSQERGEALTVMGLLSVAYALSGRREELCEQLAEHLERAAGAVAREAVN